MSVTTEYDVAVLGLGSVGSAAAWQLASTTGLSVVGLEQYGVGHTYGSYAGESRVFRVAYHEGPLYVPLLLRSRELWEQIEVESGRDLLLKVGTLSVDMPAHASFEATLNTARTFGLPHDYLETAELRRRYPQHVVPDGTHAIFDKLGGGLRSEAAVLTMVDLARRAGATIIDGAPIIGIDESFERIEITLSDGCKIRAAQVVATLGSWTSELRPQLSELIEIQPVALTWFAPRNPGLYTPDRFPTFLRDQDDIHMFGVPTLDGYSIKVVSHNVDEFVPVNSVADINCGVSREAIAEIGRNAKKMFPDLYDEPVRHSLHHEGFTHRRIPIVDLDETGRIVVVCGLSGHGFKLATGLGQLATSLITNRTEPLYQSEFSLGNHRSHLTTRSF